jgi:E3 ubiquitin-protein ligase listerin
MPKPQSQARSSRVAVENVTFGHPSGFGKFGTATSPFSYLAELSDSSSISNPQTIVIFKNLAKKDSTTKARALEELQNTLSDIVVSKGDLEEAIIAVWVSMLSNCIRITNE